MNNEPMKKNEPRFGLMSIVFLPNQPSPGAPREVAFEDRSGVDVRATRNGAPSSPLERSVQIA